MMPCSTPFNGLVSRQHAICLVIPRIMQPNYKLTLYFLHLLHNVIVYSLCSYAPLHLWLLQGFKPSKKTRINVIVCVVKQCDPVHSRHRLINGTWLPRFATALPHRVDCIVVQLNRLNCCRYSTCIQRCNMLKATDGQSSNEIYTIERATEFVIICHWTNYIWSHLSLIDNSRLTDMHSPVITPFSVLHFQLQARTFIKI